MVDLKERKVYLLNHNAALHQRQLVDRFPPANGFTKVSLPHTGFLSCYVNLFTRLNVSG